MLLLLAGEGRYHLGGGGEGGRRGRRGEGGGEGRGREERGEGREDKCYDKRASFELALRA